MIKQYCRYCAFCSNGDAYYCSAHDKTLCESTVKRANKCRDFAMSELGDVDTGKKYTPQISCEKIPCDYVQMSLLKG